MWLVRLALRPNYNYLVQMTIRQSTSSTEIGRKWRAIWKDFVQKTDFMKSFNSDGWKGDNRAFLWYAIEDRFSHEFAYVFEPIKEAEPPKLLQMRALQKEMCAEALKRGTWFLVPQHD
uniref:WGS project CBMI000000000 data, contig n=1 Tax=Elaeophora elaphi TaxID=1147741 RepID=A0A0R3S1N4_9BILA